MGSKAGKYFISYMDVLGFRSLVVNKDLQKVHNSLETILVELRNFYLTGRSRLYGSFDMETGHPAQVPSHKYSKEILKDNIINFSDSIIFYITCSEDEEENKVRFESICWLSNEFIAKSILTTHDPNRFEIALRCGIAFGDAIIDKDNGIFTGLPIIDAYDLSECQQWMGGTIHPSVPTEYKEKLLGYDKELFIYPAPSELKEDVKSTCDVGLEYSLNWVKHHPSLPNYVHDLKRLGPTLLDIGGHVKRYKWEKKDNHAKGKNTLDFVKKIDEEWNKANNVINGTDRKFNPPDWYLA